jgi:hypothetical protein
MDLTADAAARVNPRTAAEDWYLNQRLGKVASDDGRFDITLTLTCTTMTRTWKPQPIGHCLWLRLSDACTNGSKPPSVATITWVENNIGPESSVRS